VDKNKIVIIAPVAAGILMLAILAVISSTNQAFAQAKPTSLSLSVSVPNNGKVGVSGTLGVGLSGDLTSEGSGVAGATITFTLLPSTSLHATTTGSTGVTLGHFFTGATLRPGTQKIEASYAGDNDHQSSSATREVVITH
jgi:hypothetical protein